MKIFDATLGTLERALDFAAAMREQVGDAAGAPPTPRAGLTLASAGHATFGAGDIPLAAAGEIEPAARGASGSPVTAVQGAAAGLDGNAVDVDRALAAVAENAIQYNAAARAAQKKLAILRYVASDGAA